MCQSKSCRLLPDLKIQWLSRSGSVMDVKTFIVVLTDIEVNGMLWFVVCFMCDTQKALVLVRSLLWCAAAACGVLKM